MSSNYSDYWKARWEPSQRVADLVGLLAGAGPSTDDFVRELLTDFGYKPFARIRDEFRELRGFGYVHRDNEGMWFFTKEGACWALEKWNYIWLVSKEDCDAAAR